MIGFPVACFDCGATAAVNRVTANLHCGCGSVNVDVLDGSTEQLSRLAVARGVSGSFLAFMRSAASPTQTTPVGTEIPGWNAYTGPAPGPNPFAVPKPDFLCPECRGSKTDMLDGGTCRACGGDGMKTPTTAVQPAPEVARHQYPSTQTKIPFVGHRRSATAPPQFRTNEDVIKETTPDYTDRGWERRRTPKPERDFSWESEDTHFPSAPHSPAMRHRQEKDYSQPPKGHFEMPGAWCPNCGQDPTHLVKDHKEDAWWHCPNCGPLANIDKDPTVDPYEPGESFEPNPKAFRPWKKESARRREGSLLRIVATMHQHNPGLLPREIVHLARRTVKSYLEQS